MNIKKCSRCGFEVPGDSSARTCLVCKQRFKMGYCGKCGEWSDRLVDYRCQECCTKRYSEWTARKKQEGADKLVEWQQLISKQSTQALTEEQWLAACTHFGGCAYCGDPEIASRSMFIDFKSGGRYAAWNIIPACEKCETIIKVRPNPFVRLNRSLNRDKESAMRSNGYDRDTLQRITRYLRSTMEVNNESGET